MKAIRRAARQDGARFIWINQAGRYSKQYRTALFFGYKAHRSLRKSHIGAHCRFHTRVGSNKPDGTYVIRVEALPTKGDRVVDWALEQIGTPYIWGAQNGPDDPGRDAFDCSGFTAEAWSQVGIFLPHNAELQRTTSYVQLVPDLQAEPGDLVFMCFPGNSRNIRPPHASHVGIYYGNGKMIDTRSPDGEPVAVRVIDWGAVVGIGRVG